MSAGQIVVKPGALSMVPFSIRAFDNALPRVENQYMYSA